MVVCGCLFMLALSILIVCFAISTTKDWLEARHDRLYYKALAEAKVNIGRHLIQDAYWLKDEALKTMHLLGVKLTQEGGYDIAKFREELETYEVK